MADVAKTVSILFKGEDQTSPALAAVEKGLNDIGRAGDQVKTAGDQIDKLATAATFAKDVLVGAFGAFSIAKFVQSFVDANVELEKFSRAAAQIVGSTDGAAKELGYLKGIADTLGLSVRGTADSYIALLAATKNTALEGEPARRIFEAISTAMSLLGRSSADTQGALLAVQQIVSKGTVSAEELRGQLGERLPGAFQIAARSVGVTTEELGKMLEQGQLLAVNFLPKFAAELEKTFGGVQHVDTYTAAVNRLSNQWDNLLQILAKSGAFDFLTGKLKGTADGIEETGVKFEAAGLRYTAFINLLRGGGFDTYMIELKRAQEAIDGFEAKQAALNQTQAETARLTRQNAEAAAAYRQADQSDAETERLIRQANAQTEALKQVGDAFKTLGLNPDKLKAEIEQVIAAFDTLAASPSVKGDQLLQGLEAALKRVSTNEAFGQLELALQKAFDSGRLTADQFSAALDLVAKREEAVDKAAGVTTQSLEKQAAEAQRAKEKAEALHVELEKIASNERIKLIEARVSLNVAQVEADTKRIQSAFESINTTIESTADIINNAFGLLAGGEWIDSTVRNKLMDQIDKENDHRAAALRLQSDLTRAQIDVLKAQQRNLERGDAMIKVDGAGLKPHLEAFMWEILKAIQVRVNNDGLKLLLGV